MLVIFSSPAHGNVTMFGEVAIRLIKMMGHSGTVPSAILADDVPAALERLQKMVATEEPVPESQDSNIGDDEEPAISLQHRAGPLLDLLEAAKTASCDVMWESS